MKSVLLAGLMFLMPFSTMAAAVTGKTVPTFEVKDATGKAYKTADLQGKWIVMEWFNKDCPYVKKHYGSGNMQALQNKYVSKGVVWLTVLSSAKGKQGAMTAKEVEDYIAANKTAQTAVLMDIDGKVGKTFGAKTTPHMFVINPKGTVIYAGAIDDNDSADASVIPASKNYVSAALDAAMATPEQKIEVASTKPYGCSVKY